MLPALELHSIIVASHTCTGSTLLEWPPCHPELVEGLLGVSCKDEQGFDRLSLTTKRHCEEVRRSNLMIE